MRSNLKSQLKQLNASDYSFMTGAFEFRDRLARMAIPDKEPEVAKELLE